jgi:hypothetical protein
MLLEWVLGQCCTKGKAPLCSSTRQWPQHAKLAAYERELIGLVHAVRHWRTYLWAREFVVRTDHCSLKDLLDQRLSTIPRHTWVSKLFGYSVQPSKQNTSALSRCSVQMRRVHSQRAFTRHLKLGVRYLRRLPQGIQLLARGASQAQGDQGGHGRRNL